MFIHFVGTSSNTKYVSLFSFLSSMQATLLAFKFNYSKIHNIQYLNK